MMFATGHYTALKYLITESSITNNTWLGKIMEHIGVPLKIVQNK